MYENHSGKRKDTDLIFGFRAVAEAVLSGKDIDKVLLKRGLSGDLYHETFELLRQYEIPVQFVPIEKINSITRKNHQGIVAWTSPVTFYDIENYLPQLYEQGRMPLLLALDGITDVRNFGAIIRTAACTGVDAALIPDRGAARVNADAVKTSAGGLLTVPICRTADMKKSLLFLQQSGIRLIAATEKADKSYIKADFSGPAAIIMGAEDTGISAPLLKMADEQVAIPVFGPVQSLNVSVAAGLLMYEAVRQRDIPR
ncbi:MAG: 23S rRNA (guanosine(2251)-2'-O)-methyltransferase RlmB [Bacteroidales bacterium]|jgi:23S rRNA (guanosine2251-2'-O)-methyltransferase|nr:23S rRNA (guanosine(2251)-2'-O)-methyltransferase RlmB [Bacteroidales bacterium]